jgi:hypothetical protein
MHREPVNQGEMDVFNFMTILIVAAIVFFLAVHPYSSASSAPIYVGQVITCLLLP